MSWVSSTLNVTVSETVTVPPLVVVMNVVPVLVVVSDWTALLVVVPVCVTDVALLATDDVVL